MRRVPLSFSVHIVILVLSLALSLPARAETCFTATIDGIQSGTGSTATGTGRFILNDAETELTYNIEFSGLGSMETAAHIHSDAEGGTIVHPLTTGSPKIGVWKSTDTPALTPQRIADLKAGQLYVNIHSADHPAGEIRGQINQGACALTCFTADIDGAQAGTPSTALGTGAFVLNHTQTELTFHISFSGLGSMETAAHIHSDAEGGAIVHPLPAGNLKIGVWKNTDTPALTPQRVADLLNNQMYINIHTSMHPAGEIRGQVILGCGPTGARRVPRGGNALQQNYPNPFNPSTTIRYSLRQRSRVVLAVFNVNGERVRTLVNGDVNPGADYRVVWDGTNDAGQPVPSGIYFYRLVTGGFTETRKMLLVK